ncbi:HNH endonuclease [Caballeronia sp. 15711]|uniref:HNH endonuclease n=1 Tax=Caballeronia sp. 15711 TaxID=3391029 RepID=UPI0039E3C6FB
MTFRLPDFLSWGAFNTLRHDMGAPLVERFGAQRHIKEIELPLVERLKDGGVDVSADQIKILDDGTLAYKGFRVLVYIRDVPNLGHREEMPRYHLAYCHTLEMMYRNKRSERYVVANSDSGLFNVNVIDGAVKSKLVALNVCQNCLASISWMGFDMQLPRPQRLGIVSKFALPEYFTKYPRDLFGSKPKHTSDTAPINDYTRDWSEVSDRTRKKRGYCCGKCRTILNQGDAKFLHVHHRNGQKNDNSDENLEVLCIGCHAEEPFHAHIKRLPNYRVFMQKYRQNPNYT